MIFSIRSIERLFSIRCLAKFDLQFPVLKSWYFLDTSDTKFCQLVPCIKVDTLYSAVLNTGLAYVKLYTILMYFQHGK